MKNRVGIYFFYDKDGIVDDYVYYYIEKLKEFCSELCVVVNGKLTDIGKEKFKELSNKLIIRENVGFDSMAYKEAMESYGYDKLKEYDELILCNFTCFGPVYPFKEMFDEMDKRDCDFWGIARYPRKDVIISKKQDLPYVPEHVMSYFVNIKQNMVASKAFEEYWNNLETAHNYAEAIVFNELRFTKYFEEHGFKSDTLISREVMQRFAENVPTFNPVEILNLRCPLVKRRAFISDYSMYTIFGTGAQPRAILDTIQEKTDYDINLIWQNLLRTMKGSELKRNLHLNFLLDEKHFHGNEKELKENTKVALMIYSYYEDMADYAYSYAKNLPEWADIYIYVVTENGKKVFEEAFSKLKNKVHIEIKENRGQLASAVMISAKELFKKYDYVCVTQTKKSTQLRDAVDGEDFCNHCWNGVLKSPEYVLNVIQSFYDNPRLGYACSLPPHWSYFNNLIGHETEENADNMKEILKKFNIPESYYDSEPIASYGECYWVRGKGYNLLIDYPWKHEDFPEAKLTPKDGCILNALERLNPIFVQVEGYYSAWVMPLSMISVYLDNIYYEYRNSRIQPKYSKKKCKKKIRIYTILKNISFGKLRKKYDSKLNKYKKCLDSIEK